MPNPLLDALMRLDNAARLGARVLAPASPVAREFTAAVTEIRRELAVRAVAHEAAHFDPKTDLKRIFAAAEAAGLAWPDLAEALNTYHAQNLRG